MKDIVLEDNRRLLIIESSDILGRTLRHLSIIRNLFQACRARYQVVIVLVDPSLGSHALPQWMRGPPLRPRKADFGGYWIMEQNEGGEWLK